MTDFILLHIKGKEALVRIVGINGITHAEKGKGTFIGHDDERFSGIYDESFDAVFDALTALEVEIVDCANDG